VFGRRLCCEDLIEGGRVGKRKGGKGKGREGKGDVNLRHLLKNYRL